MTTETRFLPLPDVAAHLVVDDAGRRRIRLRTGRFVALDAPPSGLEAAVAGELADADTAAYLGRLRAEVNAREAEDSKRRWPAARRAVHVIGTGPVVEALGSACAAWGARITRGASSAAPPEDAAIVIAYADDARARRGWSALDELPERGIAWLRAYREGECVFVDPIAVDASDAASAHVDARRIAASTAPDLAEAWQRSAPCPAEPLDGAASALLLGRMLHVVLAWAQDDASLDRHRTTLWKLVPALGSTSEHTVLRYPAAPVRVRR